MTTFPNIKIDTDSTFTRTPRVLRNSFGDGYSQVLGDGINAYDEQWQLTFTKRPVADITTIKTFLDTNGGTDPFDWQAPLDGSSKKWRFIDKYSISGAEGNVSSISFTIQRYFGA